MTVNIEELKALLGAATPGEWQQAKKCDFADQWEVCNCGGPTDDDERGTKVVAEQIDYCMAAEDDAALIVALHNAAAALIKAYEEREGLMAGALRVKAAFEAYGRADLPGGIKAREECVASLIALDNQLAALTQGEQK